MVDRPLYTDSIRNRIQGLRTELQRNYSRLESKIKRYGGSSTITDPIWGDKHDIFDVAFDTIDPMNYMENMNAINKAIKITNKAIGRLEAEGETWKVSLHSPEVKSVRPKIFISHSGRTVALKKLDSFLKSLGLESIIVMEHPNLDRTVNAKVEKFMDESDLVIFLATGEGRDKKGKRIPGDNVTHEIGLSQGKTKHDGKRIYLLENGASFGTNISSKVYIRFTRNEIEKSFKAIEREIKGMGYL